MSNVKQKTMTAGSKECGGSGAKQAKGDDH
jgi:hypothetical protein